MQKFSLKIMIGVFLMTAANLQTASAHEEGAPFSGAIIDPLEVHHAHIENEQRINFALIDHVVEFEGEEPDQTQSVKDVFTQTLELAWADASFTYGMEVFIPFSNEGQEGEDRKYGLGDITFQPIKYAFLNSPETIISGNIELTLPTGDESVGLGADNTKIAPHILVDKAWGNWFVGINQAIEFELEKEENIAYEYKGVLSYSFINETVDVAPSKPNQSIVPQLSVEFLGEAVIDGEGKPETSILPGINLWNPESGWSLRLGIQIPLSDAREGEQVYMIQFGNHFNWGRLFEGG